MLTFLLTDCATTNGSVPDYVDFYNTYSHSNDVMNFKIPVLFLSAFLDKDDEELKVLLKKVNDISIFIAGESRHDLYPELYYHLPDIYYHDVMIIKDGAEKVTFKVKETEKGFEELLMIVEDKDELVIMCMEGRFTKADVKEITESINIEAATNTRL